MPKSWKKSKQPIKVIRISETDFDDRFWAEIADSLFRDLCQFPADYENKLIGPTVGPPHPWQRSANP